MPSQWFARGKFHAMKRRASIQTRYSIWVLWSNVQCQSMKTKSKGNTITSRPNSVVTCWPLSHAFDIQLIRMIVRTNDPLPITRLFSQGCK